VKYFFGEDGFFNKIENSLK